MSGVESAPDGERDATGDETVTVRYDGERLRFEAREDGWRLFEETWTGCSWRTRGTRLVEELTVAPE